MASEQSTSEELVARALESLTSQERQQVTAWLLRRSPAPGTSRLSGNWMSRTGQADPLGSQSLIELAARGWLATGSVPGAMASVASGGQGNQVVPVRLPAELHSRLREWASEHGFSMATVVRGLVSRFLEGQEAGEAVPDM